jgi:glycerol-3-phosphate dehydrogenase (NAD(P)+)
VGLLTAQSSTVRARVAVLGAGAWGTAFAMLCARRHDVRLWARDRGLVERIVAAAENPRYLPGVQLPESVRVTADAAEALDGVDVIVSAVPASALPEVLEVAGARAESAPLLWLSKGLVEAPDGTVCLPHALIEQRWRAPAAVLSGPSFAIEVARGLPTAVTVAAADIDSAAGFAGLFRFDTFRTYATDDLVGVEVAGAVKNVLAIAAGISDGLEFGHNARAALITRGLAESARLSDALGGRRETMMGLSGLGDLVLTCTGDLSRNRRLGIELARGRELAEAFNALGHVVEGVGTARRLARLAVAPEVDMPICSAVQRVLFEGLAPRVAVGELLRRGPRTEAV